MSAWLSCVGRFSVRFRWLVIAFWVLGTFAGVRLLPSLSQAVNNDSTQYLSASAPSNVAQRLATPFYGASNDDDAVVVAATSDHRPLTTADRTAITRLAVAAARPAARRQRPCHRVLRRRRGRPGRHHRLAVADDEHSRRRLRALASRSLHRGGRSGGAPAAHRR